MSEEFDGVVVGEHRLILRERISNVGRHTIECSMEGSGVDAATNNPTAAASTGYLLLGTLFRLYANGTAMAEMNKLFGTEIEETLIT